MPRFAITLCSLGLVLLASCGGPVNPNAEKKPSGAHPVVAIETSLGNIKAELYTDQAPLTVRNFLQYVDEKHYDGTIFHRVISKFMIQGGGFLPDMTEKGVGQTKIKNEAYNGLSNKRGTLAMARTNDPHSATDQFFINTVDNEFLDKAHARDGFGYTVFGKVTEGMDVVDKIRAVPTGSRNGQEDVPTDTVLIKSIRRVEAATPPGTAQDEKK